MTKVQKIFAYCFFALYLFFLAWSIVFKSNIYIVKELLNNGIVFDAGAISFDLHFNGRESLLNIGAFVPLGLYLMLLSNNEKFFGKIFICFLLSLSFEVSQYILKIGTSDITDLITNTLGGAIGIVIYLSCKTIFKEKLKTIVFYGLILLSTAFCALTFIV